MQWGNEAEPDAEIDYVVPFKDKVSVVFSC